jgi:Xaa-Pro aminopeptidase
MSSAAPRTEYIAGVARAQAVAREAILTVAQTVRAGDSERDVVERIERELDKAKVHHWLHTAYAWWGERTRFDHFGIWETSALPSDRRLAEGEAFILDVAPIVAGHPADFAYSGFASSSSSGPGAHAELLAALAAIKSGLLEHARQAGDGAELCQRVAAEITGRSLDVIHSRYPAAVLGHSLEEFPNAFAGAPRIGSGFQLPLLATYGLALVLHHLSGARYPFLNATAPGVPSGLYAVEPHIGSGPLGAKFESILLVAGAETRWLDPDLFGEVQG